MRLRSSVGVILAGLMLAISAPAASVRAAATEEASSAEENLRTMASIFFLDAALRDILSNSCEVPLRAVLNDDETLVRMDGTKLPGIIDYMVAAGQAYCSQLEPAATAQVKHNISEAWASRVTWDENARLAQVYRPLSVALEETRAQRGPRGRVAWTDDMLPASARFDYSTRYAAMSKTSEGRALLEKVLTFQTELNASWQDFLQPFFAMRGEASKVAVAAGNAYAKERGYGEIYPTGDRQSASD